MKRHESYDRTDAGAERHRQHVWRDIDEAQARGWSAFGMDVTTEPPTVIATPPQDDPRFGDGRMYVLPEYGHGSAGGYEHTADDDYQPRTPDQIARGIRRPYKGPPGPWKVWTPDGYVEGTGADEYLAFKATQTTTMETT